MKKLMNKSGKWLAMALLVVLGTMRGYAQAMVYTYDLKVHHKASLWYDGPLPIILFGTLFVVGIYVIYHYWSNGQLRDDMS